MAALYFSTVSRSYSHHVLSTTSLADAEITLRLDESDVFSSPCGPEGETERFASTGSTGRRVSFNESALYEQEKKTEDKGRR